MPELSPAQEAVPRAGAGRLPCHDARGGDSWDAAEGRTQYDAQEERDARERALRRELEEARGLLREARGVIRLALDVVDHGTVEHMEAKDTLANITRFLERAR